MSNVLIGIIGVILFIGLALAGALILGEDFTSSKASTDAAALIAQMQQISQAGDMYRLKTGRKSLAMGTTDFLVPRFLKTPGINPTPAGKANPSDYLYVPHFNNDVLLDRNSENGGAASYLMAAIGRDSYAGAICQHIADTHSNGVVEVADIREPVGEFGCHRGTGGEYLVWKNAR